MLFTCYFLRVWQEWEIEKYSFVAMVMSEGDACSSNHRSTKVTHIICNFQKKYWFPFSPTFVSSLKLAKVKPFGEVALARGGRELNLHFNLQPQSSLEIKGHTVTPLSIVHKVAYTYQYNWYKK